MHTLRGLDTLEQENGSHHELFRKAAKPSIVDTPRRLGALPPVRLSHEALITMASFPGDRGADKMP
jgi:hypothetical protein